MDRNIDFFEKVAYHGNFSTKALLAFTTKVSARCLKIAFLLLLFFTLNNCTKNDTVSPVEKIKSDVIFLGHRGSGSSGINGSLIENTMPSIQNGLTHFKGVETDLQMSLDGTIWMFHNTDIASVSSNTSFHRSIPLSTDARIEKERIVYGSTVDRIYKLSELIDLWKATPNGFYISMEVKLDFPADSTNSPLIGGEAAYLVKFVASLKKLLPSLPHQNQLMIEIHDKTFCTSMHNQLVGIKICLLKEVNFTQQINDALAAGYDGVSCIFDDPALTADEVKRARDRGLIVQIWTPDDEADLIKVINLKPNFIQTNNLIANNLIY